MSHPFFSTVKHIDEGGMTRRTANNNPANQQSSLSAMQRSQVRSTKNLLMTNWWYAVMNFQSLNYYSVISDVDKRYLLPVLDSSKWSGDHNHPKAADGAAAPHSRAEGSWQGAKQHGCSSSQTAAGLGAGPPESADSGAEVCTPWRWAA